MIKRIAKLTMFSLLVLLANSCEKTSIEEFAAANEISIGGGNNDWDQSDKPTSDGVVVETGLVDLGLSVKWAACNLDKNTDDHFAEICSDKGSTFKWSYNDISNPPENISGTNNDWATALLGGAWRTPTKDEMQELINKCRIVEKNYRGVSGLIITGPSGKAIFFPDINYYSSGYWTSTYDLFSGKGFILRQYWTNPYVEISTESISTWRYIRPVYGM